MSGKLLPTLALLCLALPWGQAGAQEIHFEDVAQNKTDAAPVIGSHPILKSEAVNLELKVNPVNATRDNSSGTDTLNNNLGVIYNYQVTRQAKLSQEYAVGVRTRHDSSDPGYLEDGGSSLDTRQITRLTLTPAQKLKWDLTNEFRSQLDSGHSSSSDVWRYGTGLDWSLLPHTTLRPEVAMENHADNSGRLWTRREYGINLRQDFANNALSLNLRPSEQVDEQNWNGGHDTQDLRMESSLGWKLADKNTLNFGNRLEELSVLNQNQEASTCFAEWVQNPYPEMNLRLRTEYEFRELNDGATNPLHDTVRLLAGPRWNFNDGLSAGAEFRYTYATGTDYIQPKEDTVLSLSLSRSF